MSRYAETDSQRYLWHLQQVRRKKRARRREDVEPVGPEAVGGTETVINPEPNVFYRVHSFTDVGESSLEVLRSGEFEYLAVGGGGGGGNNRGGGGGGGGVLAGTAVVSIGKYNVVVGGGGTGATQNAQNGNNGQSSSVFSLTATGGEGGFGVSASSDMVGTIAAPSEGGPRGDAIISAGGGGGSKTTGSAGTSNSAGDGGDGEFFSIDGQLNGYGAGGGGGVTITSHTKGQAGAGGSGFGSDNISPSESGVANKGDGGGGGAADSPVRDGGNGGSGIVIVRYQISEADFIESGGVIA